MDIRLAFIDYFKKQNHEHIESSSLIPASDKTLLFTNSGMVQFKDIFLGLQKPKNKKIVTCQKCVRAGGKHNDLENIGYTNRHHSFFEMLGNFSFGDYFKEEAITLAWGFLINELKLDKERLYVSVHKDDADAANIWLKKIGLDSDKLWYLGDKDNFWQMGNTGPCGPCSEIFYDLGEELKGSIPSKGDTGDRFIEIWNLVFTQYNRDINNALNDLPKKCVDTGMGLERIHAVVEGKSDNFKTSLFADLEKYLDKSLNTKNINYTIKKIIMDHCRSACFLISDGIIPSNEGRGYVLRRIIRRATRFLYNAGIQEPFIHTCSEVLSKTMGNTYINLIQKKDSIQNTLKLEEENYLNTLSRGLDLIEKLTRSRNELTGENIFKLYDTYGFPSEIIQEIAIEKKLKLDMNSFNNLMSKQKELSRQSSNFEIKDSSFIDSSLTSNFSGYSASELSSKVIGLYADNKPIEMYKKPNSELLIVVEDTPFYPEGGGQISDIGTISNDTVNIEVRNVQKINNVILHAVKITSGSISVGDQVRLEIDTIRRDKITINHSSTHLLNQALRDVLGGHVEQKGSLVTDEYLRFDFSHNKPLTLDEIRKIETIISLEITLQKNTSEKNLSYKDAIKNGALAFFDEKYSDEVRVVNIGTKSMELCGGTHIDNTSQIRLFKVLNETSVSTGVRRIEAVTGEKAFHSYQSIYDEMKKLSNELNSPLNQLHEKILSIKSGYTSHSASMDRLNKNYISLYYNQLKFTESTRYKTVMYLKDCADLTIDQIKILSDLVKTKNKNSISVFMKDENKQINCYVGVSKQCKHSYNAKQIITQINEQFKSKGGGSETFGTSAVHGQSVDKIIDYLKTLLD